MAVGDGARGSLIAGGAVVAALLLGCSSIPQGRSAVDDVTLRGAEQLDDDEVLEHIATHPSPRFLGLFPGVVYRYSVLDPTQLERDQLRIQRYYQARGFYHARVGTPKVIREDDQHVEVIFRVHEGRPTTVSQIHLRGLDDLPAEVVEQVRAATTVTRDAPFDEDAFARTAETLKQTLTDAGYAHATVEQDAFVDLDHHRAELTYQLKPGPRAVYGAVQLEGLGELSETHLRNALKLRTGARYSTAELKLAEQRALQLGVFNAVKVTPQLRSGIAIVPIVVKVAPGKLRSVRVGGGARLDALKSDLHAVSVWQDRNFLGDMRSFTVDAKAGVVLYPLRTTNFVAPEYPLVEGKARAELVQRGVIEAYTQGRVEASANFYPVLVDTFTDADETLLGYGSVGAAAGLSRSFWRMSVSLRQRFEVEIPFSYRGPLDDELTTLVIAYPELDVTLDLRNSRTNPSAGFYLNNVLQVGAFGDAKDVRIRPEVRGYVPLLGERLVLAGRFAVGLLFPFSYGDQLDGLVEAINPDPNAEQTRDLQLMFFRGFFSGGPNGNRGYPQGTISPYAYVNYLRTRVSSNTAAECEPTSTDFDATRCTSPVGGKSLWEAALELRLRVAGPFVLAGFCDASDVAAGRAQLRFQYLHLSCGGGIRYDTPIGPLRLDLGYRVPGAQEPSDAAAQQGATSIGNPGTIFGAPLAVSFGIGQAF